MKEITQTKFYNFLTEEERKEFTGIVIDYYHPGKECSRTYYKNGKKHREDGPAIILYNHILYDSEYYYLFGELVEQEAFKLYVDLLKLKGLV